MTTEQIDRLYPSAPAPTVAACPEAALSLCLKGRLRGVDAQLTIRGMNEAEFLTNMQAIVQLAQHTEAIAALFDGPPETTADASCLMTEAPPKGWCAIHNVQMLKQDNERGSWWSHYLGDHQWCRGKAKKSAD